VPDQPGGHREQHRPRPSAPPGDRQEGQHRAEEVGGGERRRRDPGGGHLVEAEGAAGKHGGQCEVERVRVSADHGLVNGSARAGGGASSSGGTGRYRR
jgi:hypothetical protein